MKLLWICAASVFFVYESASYYSTFYDSIIPGIVLATLLEGSLIRLAAMRIDDMIRNYVRYAVIVLLFLCVTVTASLNLIIPLFEKSDMSAKDKIIMSELRSEMADLERQAVAFGTKNPLNIKRITGQKIAIRTQIKALIAKRNSSGNLIKNCNLIVVRCKPIRNSEKLRIAPAKITNKIAVTTAFPNAVVTLFANGKKYKCTAGNLTLATAKSSQDCWRKAAEKLPKKMEAVI